MLNSTGYIAKESIIEAFSKAVCCDDRNGMRYYFDKDGEILGQMLTRDAEALELAVPKLKDYAKEIC